MEPLITLLFALVAVVAVIYLSYRFSRFLASGSTRLNQAKNIKILDRAPLGQDQTLFIVGIGEKQYLIGATSQSIRMLSELDESQAVEELSAREPGENGLRQAGASFQNVLGSILTKRKK